MSEFAIITHYFSSLGAGENVRLSVGDDAAALSVDDGFELLVSTDTSAAGVHFPDDLFPEDIAYKAVAAAASDLAAMGASPLGMTLAISLPEHDSLWLHGFSQGLASASRDFNLPLIGGDTTRGLLSMTLTVMGQCPEGQKLLRSGARPTDLLCVSGSLGDSAFGLSMIKNICSPGSAGRHRELNLASACGHRRQVASIFQMACLPMLLISPMRAVVSS